MVAVDLLSALNFTLAEERYTQEMCLWHILLW